ncbi:MAG: hypothetical protein IJ291_07665 [Lachnospiraceae bacterium]|nr:hypothetical protein [Lachnospiraceae bacterium]
MTYKKSAIRLSLFYGAAMGLMTGLFGLCLFPGFFGIIFHKYLIWGILLGLLLDIIVAVMMGIACGLIYGVIMYNFMEKKAMEFKPVREAFYARGCLVFDDVANHMMGMEGVGGWMFVLNDSLYFKSHNNNIQVHELQIPLSNIRKISHTRSGMRGIFSTGLDIELAGGKVEKFVVNNRKIWEVKIKEACSRVGNHIN